MRTSFLDADPLVVKLDEKVDTLVFRVYFPYQAGLHVALVIQVSRAIAGMARWRTARLFYALSTEAM